MKETKRTQINRTQAGRTQAGRTQPGRTQPGRKQAGRTQAGRTQPGRTQPGRTNSATARTGTANPGSRVRNRQTAGSAAGAKQKTAQGKSTPAKTAQTKRASSNAARRNERLEQRKKELRRKKLRIILIAAIAVAAVFIVIAIMNAARVMSQESQARENRTSDGIVISVSDAVHLSFPQLSVTEGDGRLTVLQFSDILKDLYEQGYVLVDVHSLAGVNEDGTFTAGDFSGLPEGKIPLVISERDVSYPFDRIGSGYAKKLILDEEGEFKCEYDPPGGGGTLTGYYDIVPILENFIAEHPDFSYEGARGVLAVSGYNGILGYRTASYLSDFDGNPYAESYGLFDTAIEKEDAAPVIEALKERGWQFASFGYGNTSYGSESSIVLADIDNWMNEVSSLIGGTDLMMFPYDTDIGSWEPYSPDNAKYKALAEKGFRYFFIGTETESLLQIRDDYVREGIFEIDTLEEYRAFAERASEGKDMENEDL